MVKRVPVMPFVVGLATLLVVALAACDAVGASPEGETPEPIGSAGLESSTWTIESIGAITLGPDLRRDRVDIPAAALRAGFNQLRFRYRYVHSPRELGHSGDARRLAVRVSTITLRRQLRE